MRRLLHLVFIMSLASVEVVNAQEVNFVTRGNFSIGMDYQNLDYNGGDILYSPGGGIGIELGLQVGIAKGFAIQSTLGYQLHLALQAESLNGVSNKSSFNFNRKFISLGVLKNFNLAGATVKSFQIGVGTNMNFPGTLKRIENENDLGESNYDSNFGIYFESGLRIKISNELYIDPSLRYRQLSFSAKSFSEGEVSELPNYLQNLNANGLELGLTLVKKLKSSPR